MTVQVTWEMGGMDCKLWFQMIVHMPTILIVSHIVCSWHQWRHQRSYSCSSIFSNLSSIVNIVCASCNRFEELWIVQTIEIAYLIEIDEIESGRGINQISTLQRAGDTRWSSHLRSVSSLIKNISPTCEVILKNIDLGATSS